MAGSIMMVDSLQQRGAGMTSKRARDRLASRLEELGICHAEVLNAIREVPRHLFIDEAISHRAYKNDALPIGYGQTISQPYIVARMTEVLIQDSIPEKVLEVGTGSGYQTAILSTIVKAVYSVERIRDLLVQAKRRFRKLKMSNIMAKHSDGTWGWPESGPYDAIMVTAAPEIVPDSLLEQLGPDGRMVIPVGKGRSVQELRSIKRTDNGFESEVLEMVSFVPFCSGKE